MLSAEQREATVLCGKEELLMYIDPENIPIRMGGKVRSGELCVLFLVCEVNITFIWSKHYTHLLVQYERNLLFNRPI